MLRVLDAASEAHLADARELLATLSRTLTEFGALATDQAALATSVRACRRNSKRRSLPMRRSGSNDESPN
jgi:hypothetical protein